jgi:hypothetical protein
MTSPSQPISKKPQSQTFAHQSKLPKLPIPPLEDTCRRYLQSLEGLQDPKEHEVTKKAVKAFLENEGPRVQEKLTKWAAGKDRYVAEDILDIVPNYFGQLYRRILARLLHVRNTEKTLTVQCDPLGTNPICLIRTP